MHKIISHSIFFLSGLIFSAPAFSDNIPLSQEVTPPVFVYADTYPPLSHGKGDKIQGLLPDLVNQVVERTMGVKVTHRGEVWPRAQRAVELGASFALITSPNQTRLSYAYKSKQPILTFPIRFFSIKGSEAEDAVSAGASIEELKRFRFCRANADGWSELYLKKHAIKHVVPRTYESCLKMMGRDRVDIIVHSEDVILSLAQKLGLDTRLVVHPNILPESPNFHLLVSKKDPRALTFLNQFDKALKTYKYSNDYDQLLKSYGYILKSRNN